MPTQDTEGGMFIIVDDGDTPPIAQNFKVPDTDKTVTFVGGTQVSNESDTGMTTDEALAFLAGNSGFTAAATPAAGDAGEYVDEEPDGDDDSDEDVVAEHTGAMIAFVPTAEDAARLALTGGEPVEQLHLTILYLGDAVDWQVGARTALLEAVQEMTVGQAAITCDAFGAAIWNPQGDTPCVVLNIEGEEYLCNAKRILEGAAYSAVWDQWGECIPEQHEPWIPHVALQYTSDIPALSQALAKVGPITFDRVRVAFAGVVTDFPLLMTPEVAITASLDGGSMPYDIRESADCPPSKPWGVFKKDTGKRVSCHASKSEADAAVAAIYANEKAAVHVVELAGDVTSPAPTGGGSKPPVGDTNLPATAPAFSSGGTPWQGTLVIEDVKTGDGRMFAANSLEFAPTPLPLSWQRQSSEGHDQSVIVARIDNIWRDATNPLAIMGNGVFDDGGVDGAEALRQIAGGFLKGVSVDVDAVNEADIEFVFPEGSGDELADMFAAPELMIFNSGRIRGATLVGLPAFVEAQIELVDTLAMPTASPSGTGAYAASDSEWNYATHLGRLGMFTDVETAVAAFGHVDHSKVRSGAVSKVACQFLHHEILADGSVGGANLTACSTAIGQILSNPKLGMSLTDRRAAYEHLATHIRAAGLTPQTFAISAMATEVQALYASGLEHTEELPLPDITMFENPNFRELTPITVTASGAYQHIFGHGASWDECHLSFPGVCVTAPVEDEHIYYRLGEVVTASGDTVPVGAITLGTGHASTQPGYDPKKAIEHYDNTGTCVALVASGNDDFGIWVSGVILPGTPPARIMELRGAKLSGDWRRIGGQMRLVGMLAVNVPGFPVPRMKTTVHNGLQQTLTAAGMLPDPGSLAKSRERVALNTVRDSLQRRMGRDPKTVANQLRTRLGR